MRIFRSVILFLASASMLVAAPALAGIYNGASWAPPALPNSGIAQGSIFTLTGTGLGPTALQQAQSYPLPTTQGLAGTAVQVTVGTVTETCIMIYTVSTQVAAILPSATPVGTGTLTLTYQGAKSTIAIHVLAANFGTFALNEGGSGPAVVTDTLYNPITLVNTAHPGDILVLWGTGLGAVTGDETEPPAGGDLGTGVQVYVGNQPATVLYGGRSSSPGLDQINFVVPAGANGCKTSIAVLVKGVTGNVTITSIAPAGQTVCGDTFNALTTANLQKAVSSGSLNLGGIQLSRIDNTGDYLLAQFGNLPLNSLIRSYGGTFAASIGSCIAYEVSGTSLLLADPVLPTYLSAGSTLSVSGPNGSKTGAAIATGSFEDLISAVPGSYLATGAYTVTNGSGGSSVTAFSWGLTLPAQVVPTIPSSVTRSQDLTLTWTGGAQFPVVTIIGYNGVVATSPINSYVEFLCTATGSAGQFTIPSVILNLLPPAGFGNSTTAGVNLQVAGVASNRFSGSTAPGLDFGLLSAFITSGSVATLH